MKLGAAVILFALPAFAGVEDCPTEAGWLKAVKGKTVAECAQSHQDAQKKNEACIDTASMSWSEAAHSVCLEAVLAAELDKRLVPLKKKDPKAFKSEMKLQKAFKIATNKACAALNHCDGSLYKVTVFGCHAGATEWRANQAEKINASKLEFGASTDPALAGVLNRAASPELEEFAKLLCAMPGPVFGPAGRPANCEQKVKLAFAGSLGDDCNSDEPPK